jgi:hypothetical protein
MSKSVLKSTLVATAISLSLLAPAHAESPEQAAPGVTVGQAIAFQGNAALRTIRAEMKAKLAQAIKPVLPAPRTTKVSATGAESMLVGLSAR